MDKPLITSKEALKLYRYALFSEMELTYHLMRAFQQRPEGYNPDDSNDVLGLVTCIFHAGYIQGIREERLRNKQRSLLRELPGCKPIAPVLMAGGRVIPCFSMNNSPNIAEGRKSHNKLQAAGEAEHK